MNAERKDWYGDSRWNHQPGRNPPEIEDSFPRENRPQGFDEKNQRRGQCPCVRLGISIRSVLQLWWWRNRQSGSGKRKKDFICQFCAPRWSAESTLGPASARQPHRHRYDYGQLEYQAGLLWSLIFQSGPDRNPHCWWIPGKIRPPFVRRYLVHRSAELWRRRNGEPGYYSAQWKQPSVK